MLMNGKGYDISVIVTAHKEGRIAHHTMKSISRAVDYASEFGLRTEIIVILDRADVPTREYFAEMKSCEIRIDTVDFGDAGSARNYGVSLAGGTYVAFLDADDLFGKTWLKAAFDEAQAASRPCVLHPEFVVCFGGMNLIAKPKSVYDHDFHPENLIQYNYWNSVHFLAAKEILVETPFALTPSGSGFGYEDWHWHCEIIAKLIPVSTVPGTVVFSRKKASDSRFLEHEREGVVVPRSALFSPDHFGEIIKKYPFVRTKKGKGES